MPETSPTEMLTINLEIIYFLITLFLVTTFPFSLLPPLPPLFGLFLFIFLLRYYLRHHMSGFPIATFRSVSMFSVVLQLVFFPLVIIGGKIPVVSDPERNERTLLKSFQEEGDLFEGDIILPSIKLLSGTDENGDMLNTRNLVADKSMLWPDKTLYYKLSDEFTESDKNWIRRALADLQPGTCVRFKETTYQTAYMLVKNVNGCASPVGYFGVPVEMYLKSPSCHSYGTIQHEFLHALGFWHEHTRPDRDQNIDIIWDKIIPGREVNFYARSPDEVQYESLPYDYKSVMHYRAAAFSKDGYPTIVTHDKSAVIGQRVRYSRGDLAKLNRLYDCGPQYYRGNDLTPVRETPAGIRSKYQ